MSNTDELIRSVLESKKLSGEKVYGDQPLIFTASKMKSYTPPEYTVSFSVPSLPTAK